MPIRTSIGPLPTSVSKSTLDHRLFMQKPATPAFPPAILSKPAQLSSLHSFFLLMLKPASLSFPPTSISKSAPLLCSNSDPVRAGVCPEQGWFYLLSWLCAFHCGFFWCCVCGCVCVHGLSALLSTFSVCHTAISSSSSGKQKAAGHCLALACSVGHLTSCPPGGISRTENHQPQPAYADGGPRPAPVGCWHTH